MNKFIFTLAIAFFSVFQSFAKEGMWIPTMLASIEDQMQTFGLELSAEDIYSVNQSSLKDAILQFGGGCTAEVISSQGLILTNHHCGYRQIQSHSSVENNYLRDGFWAKDFASELPNPGLTALFVVSITDVTGEVMKGVSTDDPLELQRTKMTANEKELMRKTLDEMPGLKGFIRPFNYGNSYFMILTRTYEDVRLVGAPPSSIGKFGGDTDNWMWPRHTGDFSLFRIYADNENSPAAYAEDNRPYQPQKHLEVSVDGVKEGDFTMVFGFPGKTEQFLTTAAVDYLINEANPMRIKMRETSLSIIDAAMKSSEELHIKYAAKQSSISNAYKKWIGQNAGLLELNVLNEKKKVEGSYRALSGVRRVAHYAINIDKLAELHKEVRDYALGRDLFIEYFYYGPEIFRFAHGFDALISDFDGLKKRGELDAKVESLRKSIEGYFKDYDQMIDETVYEKLTELYFEFAPSTILPSGMKEFNDKYKGNPAMMRTSLYGRTVFTDQEALLKMLESPSEKAFKKLASDPAYELAKSMVDGYSELIRPEYERLQAEIDNRMKVYVQGLMELFPKDDYWYDANSTLRLTYGKVEGSSPHDGMQYNYNTTHRGMLQKHATGKDDYMLEPELAGLLKSDFFGPYSNEEGNLPVCFTGSNHTTGGNSGSPALNGKGQLVGLNFDRSWESTMSDVYYSPERCRNIMVDIRYILWVIDIYAQSGHLIAEMTLASENGRDAQIPMKRK